ncbi:uncharacterized protein LOC133779850 [Humulus lupulus]|uniref:uncharacterized protein LOC133779850 n=1 Tax=Humulus lupulus TaxID=3486 RepID=UPI002B411330|nr:uncharacterized protein LOC133779850 [Humulus lupulus]
MESFANNSPSSNPAVLNAGAPLSTQPTSPTLTQAAALVTMQPTTSPAIPTFATTFASLSMWSPFSSSLISSLTLKLDRVNFLAYKSQVVPTVIGHDLEDILFSNVSPPMTLVTLTFLASFIYKGSLAISDYVDKVKSLVDALAIAGSIISDQDIVLQLLDGLGPEFDPVVLGITSRSDFLSLEVVQALLMSHESRLERHQAMNDLLVKMSTNLAFGSSINDGYRSYPTSGRAPSSESFLRFFSRGGSEHDFDCDPHAYFNSKVSDFGDDAAWYADTGATNHVAYGMEHLEFAVPYNGIETLTAGNSKELIISHIGKYILPSHSSSPLKLRFVLKVLSITKNLVSVSKLAQDNDVFLEFHKNCCLVKDKKIGIVLLKGHVKDGL